MVAHEVQEVAPDRPTIEEDSSKPSGFMQSVSTPCDTNSLVEDRWAPLEGVPLRRKCRPAESRGDTGPSRLAALDNGKETVHGVVSATRLAVEGTAVNKALEAVPPPRQAADE